MGKVKQYTYEITKVSNLLWYYLKTGIFKKVCSTKAFGLFLGLLTIIHYGVRFDLIAK